MTTTENLTVENDFWSLIEKETEGLGGLNSLTGDQMCIESVSLNPL